jgi:hypothetical protein
MPVPTRAAENPPAYLEGVRIDQFHNLSDLRKEQTQVYWAWRKHGRLKVGEMATAVQALGVIRATMEAERQVEVEKLREEVRELRAELERQEQLRVVSPGPWPALPSSARN